VPQKPHQYDAVYHEFPWVSELDSQCLREMVVEALLARISAVRADGDPGLIASGTKTIEGIQYGRYSGDDACQKASVALRKFSRAYLAVPGADDGPSMPPGTKRG
jgi:hypothetical protein